MIYLLATRRVKTSHTRKYEGMLTIAGDEQGVSTKNFASFFINGWISLQHGKWHAPRHDGILKKGSMSNIP